MNLDGNRWRAQRRRDDCSLSRRERRRPYTKRDEDLLILPKSTMWLQYDNPLPRAQPRARRDQEVIATTGVNDNGWRFGMDSSWSPVISITAAGRCAIELMSWDKLARIQAN